MKIKSRKTIITLLLVAAGAWLIVDWGTYRWQQEVVLRDGTSLWVKRTTVFRHHGELVQLSRLKPFADGFEFQHPKTGAHIVWPLNEDSQPLLLDFDQGVPYLVTSINAGKHYKLGCPPHPYALFKYANDRWQRIGMKALPARIERANMVPYLSSVLREKVQSLGGKMDAKAVHDELYSPEAPVDIQVIDRRIVNPLHYCEADTEWVTEADGKIRTVIPLDVIYGEGTYKRLKSLASGNGSVQFLTENEAAGLGIINKMNNGDGK